MIMTEDDIRYEKNEVGYESVCGLCYDTESVMERSVVSWSSSQI